MTRFYPSLCLAGAWLFAGCLEGKSMAEKKYALRLHKQPIYVWHKDLKDASESSIYRKECPACDAEGQLGLLLVHRDLGSSRLLRRDHCTTCGQRYCYRDEAVGADLFLTGSPRVYTFGAEHKCTCGRSMASCYTLLAEEDACMHQPAAHTIQHWGDQWRGVFESEQEAQVAERGLAYVETNVVDSANRCACGSAPLPEEIHDTQIHWFGASWMASVCRPARHVRVPVDKACMLCDKPIEANAQGFMVSYCPPKGDVIHEPWHYACFARSLGIE
jgi:hypothetical protein